MDWADKTEAELLAAFASDNEYCQPIPGATAAALRKAKADGMRDAADSMLTIIQQADFQDELTAQDAHSVIQARASQIEKGQ